MPIPSCDRACEARHGAAVRDRTTPSTASGYIADMFDVILMVHGVQMCVTYMLCGSPVVVLQKYVGMIGPW